jgi:hypothetical protein
LASAEQEIHYVNLYYSAGIWFKPQGHGTFPIVPASSQKYSVIDGFGWSGPGNFVYGTQYRRRFCFDSSICANWVGNHFGELLVPTFC